MHPVRSVILDRALIQRLEVDGMLERAVLDQRAFGDVLEVLAQAHDEAEADLGIGVEFAGAELEDVAYALGGAVFAVDAVVGGGLADVGEGEVDFVVDTLHDGEDEFAEGILYLLTSTIFFFQQC